MGTTHRSTGPAPENSTEVHRKRRMRVAQHAAHLLQRVRYLILGGLLILSVLAWALLIWQSSMMSNQAVSLTMGMSLTLGMSAFLFIAVWILIMVALMFHTATPIILTCPTLY